MSIDSNTSRIKESVHRFQKSQFISNIQSNRIALFGLAIVSIMIIIAIYARLTMNLDSLKHIQYADNPTLAGPSVEHPFGTDKQARDIFNRVLYGTWLALLYGAVTVFLSTSLGVLLGVTAAYSRDAIDNLIMRMMDVLLAFPPLLLALAFVAILPNKYGLWRAIIALTLVYTPQFSRVMRGAALTVMQEDYIVAVRSLGATDVRIVGGHIIPNCLAPLTVQATLNFGIVLIDLAALSFLGFGASAGTPSWGLILSNGVNQGLLTGQWWWSFFPGLFLAFMVLGLNLLGDGMRDALDPRMSDAVD